MISSSRSRSFRRRIEQFRHGTLILQLCRPVWQRWLRDAVLASALLDVDLIFYDATTAWFECDDEDVAPESWLGLTFAPLRKRGHSKEGRDNDPQVIIALAVTRDGVPGALLPGDTADVTTVERIKENLRQMRLGGALFVGNAGLYARANLAELSKGAGRYILARPIGRVKEIKEEVLSPRRERSPRGSRRRAVGLPLKGGPP